MRIIILASIIIAGLIGCTKDDTKVGCNAGCTLFKGNFITLYNEPVAGISIKLKYKYGLGERFIVDTECDAYGRYYENIYLKDNEVKADQPPFNYLRVDIDDIQIDEQKYIKSNYLGYFLRNITSRDTTINATYYIPRRAAIKINLKGFEPILPNDRFSVNAHFSHGIDTGTTAPLTDTYTMGYGKAANAIGVNSQVIIEASAGKPNMIRLYSTKNGTSTTTDYIVNVPVNDTLELTYNY